MLRSAVLLAFAASVVAQDPANGWLSYAKGVNPANTGVITRCEAKWQVLSTPSVTGCFYSPWFGIETSDNLNLFQPVNPFAGTQWEMYVEYFQWSPTSNKDSASRVVSPGDVLHGVVTLNNATKEYTAVHTNLNTGDSVTMTIPIQKTGLGGYKRYTIVYIVFEKKCRSCRQYPADDKVTFYDINVEFDGQKVTPTWTTSYVDDVCNNRAHVVNSSVIEITWNTEASQ